MIVVGFHDHQALRIVPRKQSWSFSLLCIWISFEGFACTWCLIVSLDLVVYSVYYCRLQLSTALQISSKINILELCFHWAKWIYLSYWYKANDDLWEDVDNFVVWVDTRPQRVWDTIERSGRKLGWHHIMTLSPGLKKWSYPDAVLWVQKVSDTMFRWVKKYTFRLFWISSQRSNVLHVLFQFGALKT